MASGWRSPVLVPANTRPALTAAAASLVVGLSLAGGCSQENSPEAPAPAETQTPDANPTPAAAFPEPDQLYTEIMGTIAELPDPARPMSEFKISHEPIPHFIGRDGTVPQLADGSTGMKAMTMGFTPGPGLSLEGFQVGDRIQFDFAVNWNHIPRSWVTHLVKMDDADHGHGSHDEAGSETGAGDGQDHSDHDHHHDGG